MVEWKNLRKVSKKVVLFVQAAELHAKRDTNYQQPSDREDGRIKVCGHEHHAKSTSCLKQDTNEIPSS
jgi:hypothetical protein